MLIRLRQCPGPTRREARGVAMLEYALILIFMGITMAGLTRFFLLAQNNEGNNFIANYYARGLLGIMTQGTP
ncbi:MAG TPA: hypothetical protein VEI97_09355 [bacterium]|nr:hypothetical protein [bacterium]